MATILRTVVLEIHAEMVLQIASLAKRLPRGAVRLKPWEDKLADVEVKTEGYRLWSSMLLDDSRQEAYTAIVYRRNERPLMTVETSGNRFRGVEMPSCR